MTVLASTQASVGQLRKWTSASAYKFAIGNSADRSRCKNEMVKDVGIQGWVQPKSLQPRSGVQPY